MSERPRHYAPGGVGLRHPDFLPAGFDAATGAHCRANCPGSLPYFCTRTVNHEGDHAAHGWPPERMLARWPQEAPN